MHGLKEELSFRGHTSQFAAGEDAPAAQNGARHMGAVTMGVAGVIRSSQSHQAGDTSLKIRMAIIQVRCSATAIICPLPV